MTRADSVLNTPPTNTPVDQTRRRFLSQAAGGGVLALAAFPPPAAVAAPVDPVYGLIETHRAAHAAHILACDEQDRLD
jgi:hypothetical protein